MTEGPSPPLQRAKLALPARARSFAAARRPRRAAHTDRAAGALQGAERAAAAGWGLHVVLGGGLWVGVAAEG